MKVAPSQTQTIVPCFLVPATTFYFWKLIQYMAKHGRKRNYCSVCRSDYEDYMEHVEESAHKHFLRSNRFNRYILET